MLNDAMDQVVLVKGWKKGAYWSFPRGKINKDEKDLDCAVREVYEETGFDIRGAGLVGKEEEMKYIEITMREQHMRLYVFRGVPMDTYFEPRTRKEISKIQWYKLSDLPTIKKVKTQQEGRGEDLATNANKFYMVAPFLVPLKKWIAQQTKQDTIRGRLDRHSPPDIAEGVTTEVETAPEAHANEPVAGDMDRLLNHLRQSSQRHTPSDLPEVSIHQHHNSDASIQLKRLLNVKELPPPTNNLTIEKNASNHDTARSNSLLALLRGEPTTTATGGTYERGPPETPFEQITTNPAMPQSPRDHHPRLPHLAGLPPPPPFVFLPDHADHGYARFSVGQLPQSSGTNPQFPPTLGRASGTQQGLPNSQYVAEQAHETASRAPLSSTPLSVPATTSAPQQPQDGAAVHSRNDSLQFPSRPQTHTFHAPMAPAASKLPLPQLNSHSLALLNAFRQEKVEKSTVPDQSIQATVAPSHPTKPQPTDQVPRESLQERNVLGTFASTHENPEKVEEYSRTAEHVPNQPSVFNTATAGAHKNGFGPSRDLNMSVTVKNGTSLDVGNRALAPDVQPRSNHRDTLLSLFRKPSVPAPKVPLSSVPASSIPSGPVELSAQPSITNAVEPSRRNHDDPARPVIDTKPDLPVLQVSTEQKQRVQEAPVSATVTGPLDVPRFEVAAKKSKESPAKIKNGIPSATEPKQGYQTSPVSILRRPKSRQNVMPDLPLSKERRRVIASPQRQAEPSSKPSSESLPRPFQPQILRRPAQVPQQSPLTASSVASVAPIATLQQPTSRDRRGSELNKNREGEPSLVNEPADIAPSAPLASLSTKAPVPPEPAHINTAHVTPVRSRIGSMFSSAEDGSPKPSSPMTPNDRSFLLGYLQGVVKGDRR